MLKINLEIEKFRNYLNNSKKIVLVNHKRMDWDALWSLWAFYYILQKIWNYQILAINDEKTPDIFKFLNREEIFDININLDDFVPDLIISFDVATIDQLWEIYKNNLKTFSSTTWINIDHHISNSLFWNINIINTWASSTCEIVWDIIKKFELEKYVDKKISTFLLTGIITDTNSFLNTNSNSVSFLIAWELMKYKPNHQDIILNLFKRKPYNKLKLWWKILQSLKSIDNSKIVWNIIPKWLFIQTQTNNRDISWLIDEFITTIDWLEVAFLLYELEDKKIKWTFRTKNSNIDLNKFCSKWWWWWHNWASGFIIEWKNIINIEQEVIEELKKII